MVKSIRVLNPLSAAFLIVSMVACFSTSNSMATTYNIVEIESTQLKNYRPKINNNDYITWLGEDISDIDTFQIFLNNGTATIPLTNNTQQKQRPEINDNNYVVWVENDGNDWEIFLYRGYGFDPIQITNNDLDDFGYTGGTPNINNNNKVVWTGYDGSNWQIYLYDGSIKQITNTNEIPYTPQINDNDLIVWSERWGSPREFQIFYFDASQDDSQIERIDDINYYHNPNYGSPQVNNNGCITWAGVGDSSNDTEIYLYDGAETFQITDNDYSDVLPKINNNNYIVWNGNNGTTYETNEIYLYDNVSISQITDNDIGDQNVQINDNGLIVWEVWTRAGLVDPDVYLYDGVDIIPLIITPELSEMQPQINNRGHVVWWGTYRTYDNQHYGIFLASPASFSLNINLDPPEGGTVSGPGISCGNGNNDCNELYNPGTEITLTATPNDGWEFEYWYDEFSCLFNPEITLIMDTNKTISAKYYYCGKGCKHNELIISKDPNDGGTVYGSILKLKNNRIKEFECGRDCKQKFDIGSTALLSALPSGKFKFSHWDYGFTCFYKNPLELRLSNGVEITAVFEATDDCYKELDADGLPDLCYPLEGNPSDYRITNGWNAEWCWSSCGSVCKRHIAWDIVLNSGSIVGKEVRAAYDGKVVAKYWADSKDKKGWGRGMTIEHIDNFGQKFTTNYTHIDPKSIKNPKKGDVIGTVAHITKGGDHFHFSIRRAPYDNTSNAGALPAVNLV